MIRHITFISFVLLTACSQPETENPPSTQEPPSFESEVAFLEQHGPVELLTTPEGGRIALSGRYQGRVMTSAVSPGGLSLGWINHDFIQAGATGTQFDNYGGEDRFWLGPEGGQYSLYFPPEAPFTISNWQVPAAMQEGEWSIKSRSDTSITYEKPMELTSYSGTPFRLVVERTVRLLTSSDLSTYMGIDIPEGIQWVGFETVNRVTNTGDQAWTREGGMPSIWILGMFNPLGETYVAIPFSGSPAEEVVNDAYFGEVPQDRLEVRDGYLLFKCDGQYRSKIGIGPEHAQPVLGSYNTTHQVLTLVQFNLPEGASEYVNSMWEIQENPLGGDVVNSYNDGPVEPGGPALGGFYELETSSPALALRPGESYTHRHRTAHLTGSIATLDEIARTTLGVTATTIAEGLR